MYWSHVTARNNMRAEGRVLVSMMFLMANCTVPYSGATGPTQRTFDTNNYIYPKTDVPAGTKNFCGVCITTPGNALLSPRPRARMMWPKAACPLCFASKSFPSWAKASTTIVFTAAACGDDARTERRAWRLSNFSQPRVQSAVCVSSQTMRARSTDSRNANVR